MLFNRTKVHAWRLVLVVSVMMHIMMSAYRHFEVSIAALEMDKVDIALIKLLWRY